jgi:hypothetical protein
MIRKYAASLRSIHGGDATWACVTPKLLPLRLSQHGSIPLFVIDDRGSDRGL